MLELIHHDDCKQKWQSHEVGLRDKTDTGLKYVQLPEFPDCGYGRDYDEALQDFMNRLYEFREELTQFEKRLDATIGCLPALVPTKIDGFGNPIKVQDENNYS